MVKRLVLFVFVFAVAVVANAQVPSGISLLPNDTSLFNVVAKTDVTSSVQVVGVTGQSFSNAYQVLVVNETASDGYNLKCPITGAVKKGDVLLLSFYTRSLKSKRETGEAFIEVHLDRFINGKYVWPPLFERGISFGAGWTLIQIPFKAAMDVLQTDCALILKCGKSPQSFEIAGISLQNFKETTKLGDLPKSIVHYDGDAPDAPWRRAAAERIEKYRKGNLTVKVLDANGKPVNGASVSIKMTKIAYAWGTATNSNNLLDTTNVKQKMYRDTLLRYFNKIVFENEIKSKNWAKSDHNKTLRALEWLRQHNIPARGHVMVWPSWEQSPHLVQFKNDTTGLRAEILREIAEETTVMKNQFAEWDVVNEPYRHNNIIEALGGKKVMLDWFAAARRNTPGVKLFLNDYTMFQGEGPNSPSEIFYDNVKFLKDNGAAIQGIGEQGHIGGTPPGIDYVLQRLNHFATFGLPIQISEFDITSDDDDFKARYLRDFFTAVFSNPSTIGIMQWGFWESSHWIPAAALWDKDWNIRPEGRAFTELVSKTWSTSAAGVSAKNGEYKIRGFNGDYEITVTSKGKTVQQKYTLDSKGGEVIIKLDE